MLIISICILPVWVNTDLETDLICVCSYKMRKEVLFWITIKKSQNEQVQYVVATWSFVLDVYHAGIQEEQSLIYLDIKFGKHY